MQTIKLLSDPVAPAGGVFGTEFVQQLSAFGEQHKKAADFEEDKLGKYLDRKFKPAELEGQRFINIDILPPAIRQFIELQNRISGLDVGRSGMDSFHPEDNDAAFGFETTTQRLKREGRERWFTWLILMILSYTRLYEDTYKMFNNAREAVKQARKAIDEDSKRITKANAGLVMVLDKDKKDPFLNKQERSSLETAVKVNNNYKKRLEQEKEDLAEYEEEVLKPAEKKLNNSVSSESELENIQRNLTRTMPGRAWRGFLALMSGMKSAFNSFPRMYRREERVVRPVPVRVPTHYPPPPVRHTSEDEEEEEPEIEVEVDEPVAAKPEEDEDGPERNLD